jgi:LPS O-antigen subunit length determinant protein (WzzB/FepE family)
MIVYSIVITAFLLAAIVALVYEHLLRVKAQERAVEAENALVDARRVIVGYKVEKANRDGLEVGHATDAIYKKFLEQFSANDRVTVMFQRDDAKYYEPKH